MIQRTSIISLYTCRGFMWAVQDGKFAIYVDSTSIYIRMKG